MAKRNTFDGGLFPQTDGGGGNTHRSGHDAAQEFGESPTEPLTHVVKAGISRPMGDGPNQAHARHFLSRCEERHWITRLVK